MPVEIKELVIRTVVGQGAAESREGASGSGGRPAAPPPDAGATEEIVQECVRQVLRILTKDKER
jgi:hypothetical protein